MKPTVPFEQLKSLGNYLAQQHKEAPEAYFEGRHIYAVQIVPETGKIDVHIQWPAFRDLVSEHSAKEVRMTLKPQLAGSDVPWYCVETDIDGVTLSVCLWRSDLVPDLQKLGYSEVDIAQMDITERMSTFISESGWASSANIVMQKEVWVMDELFDQLKAAGDAVRQHNQMFPYGEGSKYIHSMSINMVDGTDADIHIQWDWFRELWREHRYQAKASLHDGSWYHMSFMHRGVRCCAIARCDELKGLLTNPLPKGTWSVWALMDLFREECKADGWDPIADDE